MKILRPRWHLLFQVLMLPVSCLAQTEETSSAAWLFSGINYHVSPTLKFSGHLGYFDPQRIKAIYLQAFIRANKHILINPAYLGLSTPDGQEGLEHGFMNAVTFMFNVNKVVIDDRNMIWTRFIENERVLNFYRNRLNVTLPLKLAASDGKIYVFDEGTYFFNERSWTRNRLAIGMEYSIVRWFAVDVSYARQHDKFIGKLNLFFITGTFHLQAKHKSHPSIRAL